MSNPWQQAFEEHRDNVDKNYLAEKYGQHKSDEAEETQALYDLRNKLKNMGKDAVMAYLKRSKMSPERKARLARELGVSIVGEEFATEGMAAQAIRLGLMAGTAAAAAPLVKGAKEMNNQLNAIQQKKIEAMKKEEFEGEQIDEKITANTDIGMAIKDFQGSNDPRLAGRSKEERRKAAIAAVLQARRKAEGKQRNEEVELQEEAKILVRVTKEDGSIFQKKIPASALQDYRKRYKTVVVVGSSEGGGNKTGGSPNVNEAKDAKPKRWWDDDGDGIGWEKGEVKNKKIKKETYSNWKEDNPELYEATKAQKSVEGKAHASYEDGEDKKKRKKNADESECDCSHEVKESAEKLANELGAELINIREFRAVGAGIGAARSVRVPFKPAPFKIPEPVKTPSPGLKPPTPAPLVPVKPTPAPVPTPKPGKPAPAPKPGKPTKPEPETQPKPQRQPTKPKPDTKTDTKVRVDTKTGVIVSTGTQAPTEPNTQTKTLTQPASKQKPTKPGEPGRLPGQVPSRGGPIRLPMPKWSPGISDPTAPASTLKV